MKGSELGSCVGDHPVPLLSSVLRREEEGLLRFLHRHSRWHYKGPILHLVIRPTAVCQPEYHPMDLLGVLCFIVNVHPPTTLTLLPCRDRSGRGWQQMIIRGLHTLRQELCQLLWLDPTALGPQAKVQGSVEKYKP